MDVRFKDADLDQLETDTNSDAGYEPGIAKAFRKRMQTIRSAVDERDFYALKSLHYEKLQGKRSHQRSMRLNIKMRLVIELEGESADKTVLIVGIEDYH